MPDLAEDRIVEIKCLFLAAIAAGSRLENGQMTIYKYIFRLSFYWTIAKDSNSKKAGRLQKKNFL